MKVVNLEILDECGRQHADCAASLWAWLAEARAADWKSPADLKRRYPSASVLPGDRIIFNIKGNSYRLDTKISFSARLILIKRVGTHAEYSKW